MIADHTYHRAGAREPTRAYSLFATEPSIMSTPKTQQRSTAVIFRFAW
jgi:hypothetical protein